MLKKITVCVLILAASFAFAKKAVEQSYEKKSTQVSFVKDGTWTMQNSDFSNASRSFRYMDAVDNDVVWGVALDGTSANEKLTELTKTSDGGESWTESVISVTGSSEVANVTAVSGDKAWAAVYPNAGGDSQGVYYTENGGTDWVRQESASYSDGDSFINLVHFFNENDGFCQGDPANGYFELYTTTDGGVTWVRVPEANIPPSLTDEYGTVSYYDAVGDNIWYGTNKGRVFRSSDKGLNWLVSETDFGAKGTTVIFTDAMNGLAQEKSDDETTNGKLNRTTDGGVTWEPITPTGKYFKYDMAGVPGAANTYVSTSPFEGDYGMSYSLDGGSSWTEWADFAGTIQVLACDFVSNNRGWAGTYPVEAGIGGVFNYDGEVMGIENEMTIPSVVTMENNYPNPFNPSTTINFALKADANVNLSVFDASGAKVSELVNSSMTKGEHKVDFNAANLAAGVYYYTINANGFTVNKKMVLAK